MYEKRACKGTKTIVKRLLREKLDGLTKFLAHSQGYIRRCFDEQDVISFLPQKAF
jgi:hypothetical protein